MYIYKTIGDVAQTKISQETNYLHDFVQYPKQNCFTSPQPRYVLSIFLNFGHLSASRSCNKASYKNKERNINSVIQPDK